MSGQVDGVLPYEVQEWVDAFFELGDKPKAIAFAANSVPKCLAWEVIRPRGERGRAYNPWRKMHTENFWVWYCME